MENLTGTENVWPEIEKSQPIPGKQGQFTNRGRKVEKVKTLAWLTNLTRIETNSSEIKIPLSGENLANTRLTPKIAAGDRNKPS